MTLPSQPDHFRDATKKVEDGEEKRIAALVEALGRAITIIESVLDTRRCPARVLRGLNDMRRILRENQ